MQEDLSHAEHLPDAHAIVGFLQRRYERRCPYTMCAAVCISVNPLEWLPIYDERTKHAHACGEAGGAHIYRVVEAAHTSARVTGQDQTVVVTGESGAGKTEVARLSMEYIAYKETDNDVIARVLRSHPVLEYIGNAQTVRNANSSRFGKLLTLWAPASEGCGSHSASVETYLLEKTRAVAVARGESNFRIFYAVLHDRTLREEYALQTLPSRILGVDELATETSWDAFCANASAVGLTEADLRTVAMAIIAILWLMVRDVASAAAVLGTEPATLSHVLSHRRARIHGDLFWSECDTNETKARARALAMELYRGMFSFVVARINACVNGQSAAMSCRRLGAVRILDIFGFEVFDVNGFDQLCINYCNERMQQLFVDDVVVMQQLEYANEGIGWTHVEFDGNARIVEMIEHTLFVRLDEATRLRASAQSFVQETDSQRPFAFSTPLVRSDDTVFSIAHFAGKVAYSAEDFVVRNADELRGELVEFLCATKLGFLTEARLDKKATLWTDSVCTRFRGQMQELASTLSNGGCHYVRCVKPGPGASEPRGFDAPVVFRQVVQSGLVQAYEVMRSGFAYRMPHAAFIVRFPDACLPRRRREALVGGGGRWGKTLVYLDAATYDRLRTYQASVRIARAMARRVLTGRAARRVQSAARWLLLQRRRHAASQIVRQDRDRAVRALQRAARASANAHTRRYRDQSEADRLRAQNAALSLMLKERDEWIFRATRILQARAGSDERIVRVLGSRPEVRHAPDPSTSETSATKSSDLEAGAGTGSAEGLVHTSPPYRKPA